jgi:hypothetical protein
MTETAKERIYREALEILRGMGINSKNRVMMPYGVAVTAQEFIEEKLEDAENLPVSTDKLSVEKLQEQLNTAKKALTELEDITVYPVDKYDDSCGYDWKLAIEKTEKIAQKALAAIGGDDEYRRS